MWSDGNIFMHFMHKNKTKRVGLVKVQNRRHILEIRIRDEFIKLGQALKLADLVSDGVEAKYVINDGLVKVNGEVDTRRGRKVYDGDVISYNGQDVKVLSGKE